MDVDKQQEEIASVPWWDRPRRSGWRRSLCYGLLITMGQLLFAWPHTGWWHPAEAYVELYHLDSAGYGNIAATGYHSRIPPDLKDWDVNNVAFFPGYPLLVRCLHVGLGLDVKWAGLLGAQLACWGFWTYLLLFFDRWQLSRANTVAALGVLVAHPAAFFLVAAFSESLFLMALLGFLYWSQGKDWGCWLLAAEHGFVMTATRIVGLPLALAPLVPWLATFGGKASSAGDWRGPRLLRGAVLAGTAGLGGVLFFLYCDREFGHWDLYLQTQRNCFGVVPDYLALLKPDSYRVFLDGSHAEWLDANEISRLSVPLTLVVFAALFTMEGWVAWTRRDGSWRQRVALYGCAWVLFYIAVSGVASVKMNSMVRYSFCSHVFLVMAAAHLFHHRPMTGFARQVMGGVLAWVVCNSLFLESVLLYRFTHGGWVA